MSVIKRIFLVTIFIICISFSFCYAIDENQLSSGSANSNQSLDSAMSINNENTISTTENNLSAGNTQSTYENSSSAGNTQSTYENTSATPSTVSTSASTDNQSSTRVSSVSAASNKSTITNILNIALLVVGVLLIFLAIAILIRLNS